MRAACAALLALVLLTTHAHAGVLLNGAGATFPTPIYLKWFAAFHAAQPDIVISYQSLGSGVGIASMTRGMLDFGATDGPMSDEQLAAASTPILHFPTVLGTVVVTFNVEHVDRLRFDAETLARIFLGKITTWNDPAIQRLNEVPLPDAPITVVHRADGSGTTYVFADYLSKVSADWKRAVGGGTSVRWPVGVGANGNDGVAGLVKTTPNSIGYVELVYATQHQLLYAAVSSRSGNFVLPSLDSVTSAAAAAASHMPADFRVSITDADAPDAYPISSFTWLLVPARIAEVEKGDALKKFLAWMLADGQKLAPELLYAPLPPQVVALERQALERIKVGE
jgi:phosphate transport system substrate-binding protein